LDLPAHTPSARDRLEVEQQRKAVDQAIARLPVPQREIVMLHFLQGLSKTDIARQLNVYPSAVGRKLERALRYLRNELTIPEAETARAIAPSGNAPQHAATLVVAASSLSGTAKSELSKAASSGKVGASTIAGAKLVPSTFRMALAGKTAIATAVALVAGLAAVGAVYFYLKPSPPIKVGVVLSYSTATYKRGQDSTFGPGHFDVARSFMEPGYELFAIVEPGTDKLEPLASKLAEYKLQDKCINGFDPAELEKLDVIFSGFNPVVPDEMTSAFVTAVRHGTVFFNMHVFALWSGFTPAVAELLGIKEEGQLFRGRKIKCTVVAAHPLLEGFDAGDTLVLPGMHGWVGAIDGTPLLLTAEPISVPKANSGEMTTEPACTLYYRKLGDGIVLNFNSWGNLNSSMPNLDSAQFHRHAVQWLVTQTNRKR
jgi:hypothetical protein